MPKAKGLKEVSYFDITGGGQVYVQGKYCYVAHMDAPAGTSILDISDPKHPKQVAHIPIPAGVHTHKVRVENDLMVVNWECPPPYIHDDNFQGGMLVYDVSNPAKPKELCFWKSAGAGVHRFDFDGRYAYITPTVAGYHLNIAMILDLKDPTKPEEVGRWWMPGQHVAGGETPDEGYRLTWCHHILRRGNRLYVAYWHAGMVILDIEDMSKPKLVSRLAVQPGVQPSDAHRAAAAVRGGRAQDRDRRRRGRAQAPPVAAGLSCGWSTSPTRPSRCRSPPTRSRASRTVTCPNSPAATSRPSRSTAPRSRVAWFEFGLRVVDIKNPYAPKEVALLRARHARRASIGRRPTTSSSPRKGLMYVIDRNRGLHILERA